MFVIIYLTIKKDFSFFIIGLFLLSYFYKAIIKLPENIFLQKFRFESQKVIWTDITGKNSGFSGSLGETQNLISVVSLATRNIQSIFLHDILPSFLSIFLYTVILFNKARIIAFVYFISYFFFLVNIFFHNFLSYNKSRAGKTVFCSPAPPLRIILEPHFADFQVLLRCSRPLHRHHLLRLLKGS